MKLFYSLLFIGLAVHSQSQSFNIDIDISNSKDTIAYLGHHFANQRYVDDTAQVIDGKVVFKGNHDLKEGIYFYYTPNVYFEFILTSPTLQITTNANDIVNNTRVKNSAVNDGFYAMQKFNGIHRKDAERLKKKLESETDELLKQKITDSLTQLNEEVELFQQKLQKKYKGSLLDRMIAVMQMPKLPVNVPDSVDNQLYNYLYYKRHYWDHINLVDPGLLRTPLLHEKINDYLDNVIIQIPDSVIAAVDEILRQMSSSEEAFRYALITFANKYESSPVMGFDKVFVHIVEEYYLKGKAPWTDDDTLNKLKERIATMKPNFIGNPAPPLSLTDTLGIIWNLYDVKAKFTVLYFYDPDCGHCQHKTPILYKSYPELREKGVEILGICTTTNEKRWKEFIQQDDLAWINLADLTGQSHFRYYYDVRSTPTVYILDKDKKIIVKKIDALQIPEVIDDLLSSEQK